jgi:8-oxoguanine deaminase
MKKLWLKNPLSILAQNAEGGVVVQGGKIIALVPKNTIPAHDIAFDCAKHVLLPGLINTHHHFYQTLTRAFPTAINKTLFPWLQALYPVWAKITPEMFRLSVRVALVELLMSGCTTAADHHYLFPAQLKNAIDIEVDEAKKLGMRVTLSRGSMNLSQKDGGLPPDSVVQDKDTILADSERVLSLFHDKNEGSMVQIALAPCSPFSVTLDLMRESAALAQKYNCQLHTHLAETLDEEDYSLATYGCRPLDLLEQTGWLSPRTWLAHGIHFKAEECEILGKHGVGVCHCPTSNGVLASGFCKTQALRKAGSPVGLGVDGSASSDSSNMMEAVRHALLINRLSLGAADAFSHFDAFELATRGSAKCLGREDIGEISVGKQADFALFTLNELRFSGAHDPLAALVLCGANRADRVMIKGEWRLIDGLPLGIDIAQLHFEHSKAARALGA